MGFNSKTAKLYRNVFLIFLLFLIALFAFIFFLMKPQVKITFDIGLPAGVTIDKEIAPAYYPRGVEVGETKFKEYQNLIGMHEVNGFLFEGWKLPSIADEYITSETIFESDIVVQGTWTRKKYKIEFDLDGGEYLGTDSQVLNLLENGYVHSFGSQIGRINLPQPKLANSEEYVFGKNLIQIQISQNESEYTQHLVGWKVIKNGHPVPVREYLPTSDGYNNFNIVYNEISLEDEPDNLLIEELRAFIYGKVVLVPIWETKTVNLTLNSRVNQNTWDKVAEFKVDIDSEITAADINVFAPVGYEFGELRVNNPLSLPVDITTLRILRDETILYIDWAPKKYEVSYDALNGGSNGNGSNIVFGDTALYDTSVVNPTVNPQKIEIPVKNGYRFAGWTLDKDAALLFNGTAERFDFASGKIVDETTFYAVWEEYSIIAPNMQNLHAAWFRYSQPKITSTGATQTITGINANLIQTGANELIIPTNYGFATDGTPIQIVGIDSLEILDDGSPTKLESIVEIKVPKGITSIDPVAFEEFSGLQRILVDSRNNHYDDDNGSGVLYNKTTVYNTEIKQYVVVPEETRTVLITYPIARADAAYTVGEPGRLVKTIGDYAFYKNKNLRTLTLHVENVGAKAFSDSNITKFIIGSKVNYQAFGISTSGEYDDVFSNMLVNYTVDVSQNQNFKFENGALYVGETGFETLVKFVSKANVDTFVVNSNTKNILSDAFVLSNVKEIDAINVTSIGNRAFSLMHVLSNIRLGGSQISGINKDLFSYSGQQGVIIFVSVESGSALYNQLLPYINSPRQNERWVANTTIELVQR